MNNSKSNPDRIVEVERFSGHLQPALSRMLQNPESFMEEWALVKAFFIHFSTQIEDSYNPTEKQILQTMVEKVL